MKIYQFFLVILVFIFLFIESSELEDTVNLDNTILIETYIHDIRIIE